MIFKEQDKSNTSKRYGITKAQLVEIQERFRKQKEEYEHQNKVFLADERKKKLFI